MPVYEELLGLQPAWALEEASMHFEERSAVYAALREIIKRLEELKVPYALAGGLALFLHGYRRFTEDVNLLVSKEGLASIHEHLEGRGYVALFSGSKNLRDTRNGVRIEFLVSGDYLGDGLPKPVAFPDPLEASTEREGIRVLSLEHLVELKLASGLSDPGRLKDLADVQELIHTLALPLDFSQRLDPSVQEKYQDLWSGLRTRDP